MSEHREAVAEAVAEILDDHCSTEDVHRAEAEGWNAAAWSALSESGFTLVSVPEERGGSGGDVADACAVLEGIGRFAAAVPVAESALLGGWALARAGLDVPATPLTAVTGHPADTGSLTRQGDHWQLSGRWHRVPWARQAEHVVVVAAHEGGYAVALVPTASLHLEPGSNLAREGRDLVTADGVAVEVVAEAPGGVTPEGLRVRGALARTASTAGALRRISELTARYTSERHQFGRPIGRFQAVQRHVVRVAERASAVGIAAECAAVNARPDPDWFDVAAAKTVASESATVAAQAAHQAHGAIGMTKEYALGHFTPRIWSWRDEFGNETWWSRQLGRRVVAAGADALYPRISLGCSPAVAGAAR